MSYPSAQSGAECGLKVARDFVSSDSEDHEARRPQSTHISSKISINTEKHMGTCVHRNLSLSAETPLNKPYTLDENFR